MGHLFQDKCWEKHSNGVTLVINKWLWKLEKSLTNAMWH